MGELHKAAALYEQYIEQLVIASIRTVTKEPDSSAPAPAPMTITFRSGAGPRTVASWTELHNEFNQLTPVSSSTSGSIAS
jgi:hypothetical protein